jgi:hypothetical protein
VGVALLIISVSGAGCYSVKPQKGGAANTSISRPGQTNTVTLAQSDNPKEPSTQSVQSEQTVEYILPPGTCLSLPSAPACLQQPSLSPSFEGEGQGRAQFSSITPGSPTQPRPPAFAVVQKAMPVKMVLKDHTETSIGGAQRDVAREWARKAANMQPVMWAGIIMMTVVAGILLYFGWWTKAALAIAVGVGMVVVAQTLPDHGTLILLTGLGVFGLAALLILYAYHKGQLDQNRNGIPDFLERGDREVKP